MPFGDFHIGNKNSDVEAIKAKVRQIEENGYYWIGMGDYIDAIAPKDARFDGSVVDTNLLTSDQQTDFVIDLLYPIKDKCLGILIGNHEDKVRRDVGVDVVKRMCRELKAEYLGYNALIRLTFVRGERKHYQSVDIFATHGFFQGRTRSGRITRVEQLAQWINADIYLMGHTHDLGYTKDVYYTLNNRASNVVENFQSPVLGVFLCFAQALRRAGCWMLFLSIPSFRGFSLFQKKEEVDTK